MLFGGRASYTTHEPRDLRQSMRRRMAHVFPQLADTPIAYCWGGNIGVTSKRMPHIGRYGKNGLFAHGYSGHGVVLSNLYGKILADAIAHDTKVFDLLARFTPIAFPGGHKMRAPLLALAMLYYRMKDWLP
ncbi:MAG: FAD-binding oxidoreductase [Pseudomonadota bacterium]